MQAIYNQIQQLLDSGLSDQLGFDSSRITFKSENDTGLPVAGWTTDGIKETIEIPDEYMAAAGAQNAQEFLDWLKRQ